MQAITVTTVIACLYMNTGITASDQSWTSTEHQKESVNEKLPWIVSHGSLLFEAVMQPLQLQCKSFINKNLPFLMIKIHKNVNCFKWAMGSYCLQIELPWSNWTPSRPLIYLFVQLFYISFDETILLTKKYSICLQVEIKHF